MPLLTTLSAGASDVVLSSNGATAYLSTADGYVTAFNVATGQAQGRWKVGSQLGGMDVSPDGRYLIVAERQVDVLSGSATGYDVNFKGVAKLHRLDLQTGEVRDFTLDIVQSQRGFYDVAWMSDGTVLASQTSNGFNWVMTLDVATGQFTKSKDTYSDNPVLTVSSDHTKALLGPQGGSDGSLYVYDVSTKTFSSSVTSLSVSGFNRGAQSMSPDGKMVAQALYGQVFVYGPDNKILANLAELHPELRYNAGGVQFSVDGSKLFVTDTGNGRVLQLSTTDWSIERGVTLGAQAGTGALTGGLYGDGLIASSDGHYLIASSDRAVVVIDLTATWEPGSDKGETIQGTSSDDKLFGYGGDDTIFGGAGNDQLYGGAGNDVLIGGPGNDLLDGGDGIDTASYAAAPAGVVIDLQYSGQNPNIGGDGVDTLVSIENLTGSAFADRLSGSDGANVLDGGAGADILVGRAGHDTLLGGAGDDVLNGGAGDDVLDGGDGFDIAVYDDATSGVTVNLAKDGVLQNTRGAGVDTLGGIEGVKGSAYNDVLRGSAGDNSFEGGRGDDLIDGGAGVDTAIYSGAAANYTWTRNPDGTWTVADKRAGGDGTDTLLNVEILKFTDQSVALPTSSTTQTVEALTRPGAAVTLTNGAFGALKDAIYSADGKSVFVSDSDGYVVAFNAVTGEAQGRWKVGTQLNGMDVTADGRYLYVADQQLSAPLTYAGGRGTVHRLDLSTGQVTDFTADVSNYQQGFYDVAVTKNGLVLVSPGGTNYVSLWTLDPLSGQFGRGDTGSSAGRGALSVTADRSKVLLAPGGTSDTTLFLYDAATKALSSGGGEGGSSNGVQAISTAAGMIARSVYTAVSIYDFSLKKTVDLTRLHPELRGDVAGLAFSADGSKLFLLESQYGLVIQMSTSDWSIERALDLNVSLVVVDGAFGDRLSVSPDGRYLLAFTGGAVTTIDLQANWGGGSDKSDVLVGDSGPNRLFGFGGDDVLDGRGGGDILDGGPGSDTVDYGQAGGPVFASISSGYATILKASGSDQLRSIENLKGSAFADTLIGDAYANRLSGGGGNDLLNGWGSGDDYFDGGAGFDIVTYENAAKAVTIDLNLSVQTTGGASVNTFVSIEGVRGSAFADTLIGDNGANLLDGGAGADTLFGGGGDDTLVGGAGDDRIDGGDGDDTVRYYGAQSNYSVVYNADGSITVTDLRAGSPDGTDRLTNVEHLSFAPALTTTDVAGEIGAILRVNAANSSSLSLTAADLASRWATGQLSNNQVALEVAKLAGATTSVATLAYEFFTGKIPSQAGVDYLVSPTGPNSNNLNSAYYQSFNLENRYINFAVNLGKLGEGKDAFAAKYGALSLFDATREAYKTIFGAAPTDAKIHAMIDTRADYFAAYGGDGANGIGAKAAMVGWLLAEAQKADLGVMVRSNDAWLTDLADGSAPFAIDILDPAKGYYKADFIFGGA